MSTVLMTGANHGIGLEFTKQYAEAGGDVFACCQHPKLASKLNALASQRGGVVKWLTINTIGPSVFTPHIAKSQMKN